VGSPSQARVYPAPSTSSPHTPRSLRSHRLGSDYHSTGRFEGLVPVGGTW
jgi:hypothetical protein